MAGKLRNHDKGRTQPFHLAGCYAIPIRFLYGTAAECNFWDVVCYRAHESGGAFDTSTQELVEQTGLSRQMVGRLRRQAIEQAALVEDVSWISGRRFVLRIPGFDRMIKGVIWKPLGYVQNDWHRVVTPAIPKRVLNLYLQQPRQGVYRLNPRYIAAKCGRRFLYGRARSAAPLNLADVGKALRLLVRLGLLVPEGDGFRVDWDTFTRPAPTAGLSPDALDFRKHPLFLDAVEADPGRAERALELVETGHLDMEGHFQSVFRDLAYVRGEDYPLLKAKVYRHRNRPPGPNRWRNTWRAFQYELKRRVSEVRGPKSILRLDQATRDTCSLTLDLDHLPGQVLAVRMVTRVEWPWYIETSPCGDLRVQLELRSEARVLYERTVRLGDTEIRYGLHPDEWPGDQTSLTIMIECDQPLPGVHAEAWLEVRLRR